MKDGYYVSCYCDINRLGNVLEVPFRHDQNITLWKYCDGVVKMIHHWELERITGFKRHKYSFYSVEDFVGFLNKLLERYNLRFEDIKEVIGIPEIAVSGSYAFHNELAYHGLCHIYSTIYWGKNTDAEDGILAFDFEGGPDSILEKNSRKKKFYAGAYIYKKNISLFDITSPGMIWASVRERLGIEEGTLMALAYASKSVSNIDVPEIINIKNYHDTLIIKKKVDELIKKIWCLEKKDAGVLMNFFDSNFSEQENKISMLMKIVQRWSLNIIENEVQAAIDKFNIQTQNTTIALTGGFCLNCPSNTYIMNRFAFKKQLMIPAINDSGQAIGIGIKYFIDNSEDISFDIEDMAYYGNEINEDITGFEDYIESITYDLSKFVDDVLLEPIIWMEGRSEIGPRALGHRSILADPRNIESKNRLNLIKQRQWWRPVAPIILRENLEEWFENSFESKFMLNNFKIKTEKKIHVPAITHIDNTARVQTVSKKDGYIWEVLVDYYKKTNIPMLCNTSLNDKGEPIIETLGEAINFALRKKINIIYVNGKRIKLKNFEKYNSIEPLCRDKTYWEKRKSEENENPYGLTRAEYFIWRTTDKLASLDIETKENVLYVKKFVAKAIDILGIETY